MLTQKQTTRTIEAGVLRASTKINVTFPAAPDSKPLPETNRSAPATHMFEHIERTTLAERFPLLTCFAISFALLATALITEVECLKGSGYFWR